MREHEKKGISKEYPDIEDLDGILSLRKHDSKFPFLCSFLQGLGGPLFDQKLARIVIEAIRILASPDYTSLIGWRDSLVIYVRTHSKAAISTLSHILPYPSYYQIRNFMRKLKPTFQDIRENEDLITAFDNEQKLKKSYRIGGTEGANKMTISLCTMVLHLYPYIKTKLQFNPSLSPAKWLWYKRVQALFNPFVVQHLPIQSFHMN